MSGNKLIKAIKPRLPVIILVLVLIVSVMIFDNKKAPSEDIEYPLLHSETTEPTAFRRRVTSCRQVKPGQLEEMKRMAEEYFANDESLHNQDRTVNYIGMCVTTDSSARTDSGIVYLIYNVQVDRDMQGYDGNVDYIWSIAFPDIYPDGSMPHDIGYLVNNVVRIDYDSTNSGSKEHYRYFYGFESVLQMEEILNDHNFTILDRDIDENFTEGLSELPSSASATTASNTTSVADTETTETLPPSEG